MKIVIDVLSGNRTMNKLMHMADLFNENKQLANKCESYAAEVDDVDLDTFCKVVKEQMEATENRDVIFVAINSIDGVKQANPRAYIKPNVNALSSGEKWGTFHDALASIGYIATVDSHQNVTSVEGVV